MVYKLRQWIGTSSFDFAVFDERLYKHGLAGVVLRGRLPSLDSSMAGRSGGVDPALFAFVCRRGLGGAKELAGIGIAAGGGRSRPETAA